VTRKIGVMGANYESRGRGRNKDHPKTHTIQLRKVVSAKTNDCKKTRSEAQKAGGGRTRRGENNTSFVGGVHKRKKRAGNKTHLACKVSLCSDGRKHGTKTGPGKEWKMKTVVGGGWDGQGVGGNKEARRNEEGKTERSRRGK